MKTILTSNDFIELVQVKEYPDNFESLNGLSETLYASQHDGFTGHTREILLNGICIEHRDILHDKPLQVAVNHDFPFFKMHFEMKGFSNYQKNSQGSRNVIIDHGCHQLFFFPEVKGNLQYAAQRRYTLEIKLTLDYVKRIFGNDLTALNKLGAGIRESLPVVMAGKAMPIMPAMKKVIYEILNCPYTATFKKIYLEAKVAELLLMQLTQFEQHDVSATPSVLRKGDIEKLHYVVELIGQHIQEPCSLLELAEKAGLNDFKLKKGFKEMFGNTVFGYMTDVRMEKAKTLLLEGIHTIAGISFMVGYKNPQHFTAAFKRKFGYLPSELKG